MGSENYQKKYKLNSMQKTLLGGDAYTQNIVESVPLTEVY